jgi:hypothetical protein
MVVPKKEQLKYLVKRTEQSVVDLVREVQVRRHVVLVGPAGRGPRPAAAADSRPEPPHLRRTGPQGTRNATRNAPDNFGSAAGGFTQAPGGRVGSKLESVGFPAFGP